MNVCMDVLCLYGRIVSMNFATNRNTESIILQFYQYQVYNKYMNTIKLQCTLYVVGYDSIGTHLTINCT